MWLKHESSQKIIISLHFRTPTDCESAPFLTKWTKVDSLFIFINVGYLLSILLENWITSTRLIFQENEMPQSNLSFCPKKDLLLQYKYNVIWLS